MLHRIKVILNKIAHAPASQSGDALAQLIALGQLRGIRPLIEQEYEAMPIVVSVEDSKILRPPIDRAHARGMAEGHSRGRVEGKVEGKAEAIATILSQRFPGQVPADLSDRL
jgi:predicted transposase YdaD